MVFDQELKTVLRLNAVGKLDICGKIKLLNQHFPIYTQYIFTG